MIVSTWRRMGEPPVGASELLQIQKAIEESFGPDSVESPARIARRLAQEGAELRHPEIIEWDVRWRESQLAGQMSAFDRVRALQTEAHLRLGSAEALLAELERLRQRFGRAAERDALNDLRTLAIESRYTATAMAKDASLPAGDRDEQAEIAEWLMVWLETPKLFEQWLDLRKSSKAFKEKFSKAD